MNVTIDSFNLFYVSLSFLLSVFGSYTALSLAIRIPVADKQALPFWLISSATALGGGAIWSMHFVGMVALKTDMVINYDIGLTGASLLISILSCMLGLFIVGRSSGETSKLIMGGGFTGIGVACMHYMGMSAMIMPAAVEYNLALVFLSILIAVIAATVALWLAFNMRGTLQKVGSSIIMGSAVCGMHYTGMFAATMVHDETLASSVSNTSTTVAVEGLVIPIFTISIGLMFLLMMINQFRVRS